MLVIKSNLQSVVKSNTVPSFESYEFLPSGDDDDATRARSYGRWLSGREALLAQAFPVHPELHKDLCVCSFHFESSTRVARVMRAQAGNSMNLFAIYVQLLYFILYTKAG